MIMKKIDFPKTSFVKSVIEKEHYPIYHKGKDRLPEAAIVGRSNVGKSSLINHLTQVRALAKTSSVPGKTQTINFYLIDNRLSLVDLPGYGYSKVGFHIKKTWADCLEIYLKSREELKLILLLIDLRRTLTEEDRGFIEWAAANNKPLYYVFTKADKLSKEEKQEALQSLLDSISQAYPSQPIEYTTYSIKDMDCRIQLRDKLQQLVT